jgi:hypothetical protein
MGSIFAAILEDHAKTNSARKIPRRIAGLIAAGSPESRQTGAKTGQKARIWRIFGTGRPSLGRGKVPMKPTGSIAVVVPILAWAGQNG